ncbi:MAG: YicC/YloC family endoribonuclease [Bacteroidota bacterium]
MTGYGRGIKATSAYSLTIDIKSINHRYLELYFKIPRVYSFIEDKLRRDLATKVSRGKIEVTVTIEKFLSEEVLVKLNRPLLTSYFKAIDELTTEFYIQGRPDLTTILNLPDVMQTVQPTEDQEQLEILAGEVLNEAIDNLLKMRHTEGRQLVVDLQDKLAILNGYRRQLAELSPEMVSDYRIRLMKRIQELTEGLEVDPNRLATEVAIFADKSDINEELVRIESHLHQFQKTLDLNEPIGRKLDFMVQELNREINTIGSKANDLRISQIVIQFKSELEKIREQIQNIE